MAPVEILDIILRANWGAEPAKSGITGAGTTPGDALTFHHSSNKNSGAAEVRRIQDLHMSNWPYNLPFSGGNGWDDIGYHAVIDKNGDVYEGRRLETNPGKPAPGPYTKGSHTRGANTVAGIGICMLGDYEGTHSRQVKSLTDS
ncbi:N-acetylmuramoyl-L-alanine amidase [Roseibacillus ishigakijimensis]|uniref:N-acetylmuramoyl-L-alanine amidase n=1 Tax=Roseibacillus ishigakijimensis TaxID=454146 RepID=A0A934VJ35_9BACT|nr:N-acetylmuramoyl-L-alanine amidase [Roseibacillus ishigakijimensis]